MAELNLSLSECCKIVDENYTNNLAVNVSVQTDALETKIGYTYETVMFHFDFDENNTFTFHIDIYEATFLRDYLTTIINKKQ